MSVRPSNSRRRFSVSVADKMMTVQCNSRSRFTSCRNQRAGVEIVCVNFVENDDLASEAELAYEEVLGGHYSQQSLIDSTYSARRQQRSFADANHDTPARACSRASTFVWVAGERWRRSFSISQDELCASRNGGIPGDPLNKGLARGDEFGCWWFESATRSRSPRPRRLQ